MMIDQEVLMRMVETQSMKELRERNEQRLKEAKERLGERWLLHPNNTQQRKTNYDANRAIRNV
jgi:ElaB/YqjD/DUF883 family membrane-anchored ribosome-binding protein